MAKIVWSVIISGIGFVLFIAAQSAPKYSDAGTTVVIVGVICELAAFFLFLSGAKRYFLDDILTELKKLNAPKS